MSKRLGGSCYQIESALRDICVVVQETTQREGELDDDYQKAFLVVYFVSRFLFSNTCYNAFLFLSPIRGKKRHILEQHFRPIEGVRERVESCILG